MYEWDGDRFRRRRCWRLSRRSSGDSTTSGAERDGVKGTGFVTVKRARREIPSMSTKADWGRNGAARATGSASCRCRGRAGLAYRQLQRNGLLANDQLPSCMLFVNGAQPRE